MVAQYGTSPGITSEDENRKSHFYRLLPVIVRCFGTQARRSLGLKPSVCESLEEDVLELPTYLLHVIEKRPGVTKPRAYG